MVDIENHLGDQEAKVALFLPFSMRNLGGRVIHDRYVRALALT